MDIKGIMEALYKEHPDAICELSYNSDYELLVAVILSAECTDKRVNIVTSSLFPLADTPQKMLELGVDRLEEIIHSCGFYHNKAKNIMNMSYKLLKDFGGIVPSSMDELVSLDGVGRKTANVMLSVAFKKNAIAVDTHVFRVARRIGLSNGNTPYAVEMDLNRVVPEASWSDMHHLLIHHGRYTCHSQKPNCVKCSIKGFCKAYCNKEDE